jgi:hypothetical protein
MTKDVTLCCITFILTLSAPVILSAAKDLRPLLEFPFSYSSCLSMSLRALILRITQISILVKPLA